MSNEPSPVFRTLSEEAVAAALQNPGAFNPIAFEVGRLMNGYIESLRRCANDDGDAVPDFLAFTPRWPIETVARRLTEGALCDAIVGDRRNGLRRLRGAVREGR